DAGNLAEQALATLAADLDLDRLDQSLAIDAAVLGDAAIKVTWDDRAGRPRVAPVDPGSLVAHWAPDDPRALERMTHAYGLTGTQARQLFPRFRLDALDPDRVGPVVETWTSERWTVRIDGQLVHD